MSTATTTAGLPFITDAGLSVMSGVVYEDDQQAGRTYIVGTRDSAAARKLERDGYLVLVRPRQYALSDGHGQTWARLYREAEAQLSAYAEAIRHPDGNSDDRMAFAAYLGRVSGQRDLTAAAVLALFPGLGWDTAKSWAVEAACDMSSVLRVAQHYGEHHRR